MSQCTKADHEHTCFTCCPSALVAEKLNRLHDVHGFTWQEIADNTGLPLGSARHIAAGRRTSPVEAWVAHDVLDFAEAVEVDPPHRWPIGPLMRWLDSCAAPMEQLLSSADRRLIYHAADRGWLSDAHADRIAVSLGHVPETLWGYDYYEGAA